MANIEKAAADNMAGGYNSGKNIIHGGLGFILGRQLSGSGKGKSRTDYGNQAKLENYREQLRREGLQFNYQESQKNATAHGDISRNNPHLRGYKDNDTSWQQFQQKEGGKSKTASQAQAEVGPPTAEDTRFDLLSGSTAKPANAENKVVAQQTGEKRSNTAAGKVGAKVGGALGGALGALVPGAGETGASEAVGAKIGSALGRKAGDAISNRRSGRVSVSDAPLAASGKSSRGLDTLIPGRAANVSKGSSSEFKPQTPGASTMKQSDMSKPFGQKIVSAAKGQVTKAKSGMIDLANQKFDAAMSKYASPSDTTAK